MFESLPKKDNAWKNKIQLIKKFWTVSKTSSFLLSKKKSRGSMEEYQRISEKYRRQRDSNPLTVSYPTAVLPHICIVQATIDLCLRVMDNFKRSKRNSTTELNIFLSKTFLIPPGWRRISGCPFHSKGPKALTKPNI